MTGHKMDGDSLRKIYATHGPTIRDATPAERHLLEKQVNLEDACKTMIKKRDEGRHKIEALAGRKVYLDLRVKVLPNWRRNKGKLKLLGYNLS